MASALEGLRVIDLSRYISGPYCAMILADLGADVVKVETGRGDPSRREGPWAGEESLYFAQMNRNKRSIWLDVRTPAGRDDLSALIATADVLIENFRPGVLDSMGFGRAAIEAINPRCVTVGISGFGSDSSLRERGAFDAVVQAATGLASVTGNPDDFPLLIGLYPTDVTSALLATIGVLAALAQRERTGHGQAVEISLIDAAIAQLGVLVPEVAHSGRDPERVRNRDRTSSPANTYLARDGWVYVHAGPDEFWTRALRAIGREDRLLDPLLATEAARIVNWEAADEVLGDWIAGRSATEVEQTLAGAGVMVSRVNSISEALADPRLAMGDYLVEVVGSTGMRVQTVRTPIRMSDSPLAMRHPVPPDKP